MSRAASAYRASLPLLLVAKSSFVVLRDGRVTLEKIRELELVLSGYVIIRIKSLKLYRSCMVFATSLKPLPYSSRWTPRTRVAAFAMERVIGVPCWSDVGGRLLYNRLISTQALDCLVC